MGAGGKRIPVETPKDRDFSPEGPPSLYVHVPFCRARCGYCDFYSLAAGSGPLAERGKAFLQGLRREWELLGRPGPFSSLYVGGGTPTLLEPPLLKELLDFLAPLLAPGGEWTVEANPESLEEESLRALKEAGVTRLSLGVQSLRDRDLAFLGRVHDARRARQALEAARRLGPPGLAADLLLGLPGQGEWDLEAALDALLEEGVEHVSFYVLTVEEGTPLAGQVRRREVTLPPPEVQARLLTAVRAALTRRGLPPYEISNAAIPGRESLHNLRYWLGGDYLGLGPSAASFREGRRSRNPADLEAWLSALEEGRLPEGESEVLPPRKAASERAWLQLRTRRGLNLEEVARLADPPESWLREAKELAAFLEEKELLERRDGFWALTEEGILQADGVGGAFLDLAD